MAVSRPEGTRVVCVFESGTVRAPGVCSCPSDQGTSKATVLSGYSQRRTGSSDAVLAAKGDLSTASCEWICPANIEQYIKSTLKLSNVC